MRTGRILLTFFALTSPSALSPQAESDDRPSTLVMEWSREQDWIAFRVSMNHRVDLNELAGLVCGYVEAMDRYIEDHSTLRIWVYHEPNNYIAAWMENESSIQALAAQAARMQASYLWGSRRDEQRGRMWIYTDAEGRRYPTAERPHSSFNHTTDCERTTPR